MHTSDNMSTVLPHDHGDIDDIDSFRRLLADNEGFDRVAKLMTQLGDGTRLRIYWLLLHHEDCVTNISAIMGMSSPAVSHHLRALKDGGLIKSRRVGKKVYYKAEGASDSEYLHRMIEELMEMTCPQD